MSTRTLLLALAGVVAVAEGARPLAQTPAHLADARILGAPVVTLDVPANDASSSLIIHRLLDAAGVPYGFEGGALPADVPSVDFANPPVETLTLTGLTLGAALDAVAHANPHVHWTEADGAIFVRTSPRGQGLLEQRLPRFVVVDASPRIVLETLMRAVDPSRSASGTIGMGRPPAGRAGQPPARTGKNVTIALDQPTVLEVLQAASREDPALSWSITYAEAPGSARNATFQLSESGELTTSSPSDAGLPSTGIVPVTGDVVAMLTRYLQLAPVQLAVEQLPATLPTRFPVAPPMYVDGLPPREAIARIVAYDSRYEWSEANGIFHVRPKNGTPGRSILLDHTLPSFVRTGQPVGVVLDGLISNVASQPRGPISASPVSSQSPNRATLEAIVATPIDVSFPGTVTVREVLDAICRTTGGVSWVMRSYPSINGGLVSHSLQIVSPDGIVISQGFTELGGMTPTRAPAHPLPPAFAQITIGTVYVSIDQSGNPFARLAASAQVPMGVELLPRGGRVDDPRFVRRAGPATMVGSGSFADAVYVLMDQLPDYDFAASGSVVDVAPSRLLHDPTHFMNRPLGGFWVVDMPTRDVLCLLRKRMNPSAPAAGPCDPARASGTASPNRLGPAGAALDRPITLALDNPTPRDVLNAIIGKHGDLTWLVTYEGNSSSETVATREENAVISLGTFYGGSTIPERFVPYRDPAAVASPAPPLPGVPSRRGPPQAVLDLPATWPSVERALQRLTTPLHAVFGVEGLGQAGAALAPPAANGDYYDLSDLSASEALAKVRELGGASWTSDHGVYHVRSKALAGATSLPLDRRVDHFEEQLPDARAAVMAVRSLVTNQPFVPTVTSGTTFTTNGAPVPRVMGHAISINLSNVTIREILDEIVRQFGDAGWFVTYMNANGTYPEIQFHIASTSWSSNTTIPIR